MTEEGGERWLNVQWEVVREATYAACGKSKTDCTSHVKKLFLFPFFFFFPFWVVRSIFMSLIIANKT